jgi:hypothetical protein
MEMSGCRSFQMNMNERGRIADRIRNKFCDP